MADKESVDKTSARAEQKSTRIYVEQSYIENNLRPHEEGGWRRRGPIIVEQADGTRVECYGVRGSGFSMHYDEDDTGARAWVEVTGKIDLDEPEEA